MTNLKWTYSTNEEAWACDKKFDTKEEAIVAGKLDKECIDYGRFWVGSMRPIDEEFLTENVNLFNIEDFNEAMAESAGGEDDYAPEKENVENIEKLQKLIANFILNNFTTYLSFALDDIEEVRI
jgi:hypothetical protein